MSFYETLGIDPAAKPAEIKKAYRTKSRKHHPDKVGGDGTRQAEINRAYAVLSDPVKKLRYDAIGEGGIEDSLEQRLAKDAAALFRQAIAVFGPDGDLAQEAKRLARKGKADLAVAKEDAMSSLVKLNKVKKGLRHTAAGPDVLGDMLDNEIRANEARLRLLTEEAAYVGKLVLYLDGWSYAPEASDAVKDQHTRHSLFIMGRNYV